MEEELFKKCTPSWREAHFEVKMLITPHAQNTFGPLVAGAMDSARRFYSSCKTMAGVGCLKRICKTHLRDRHNMSQRCSEVRRQIPCEGLRFGASDLLTFGGRHSTFELLRYGMGKLQNAVVMRAVSSVCTFWHPKVLKWSKRVLFTV